MDTTALRAMQGLAREVWRRAPAVINVDATVGELAWTLGAQQDAAAQKKHRLWYDGGGVTAWGLISPPTMIRLSADRLESSKAGLVWQVQPERHDLLDDVLAWFEAETPGAPRQTSARRGDDEALRRLERHGYSPDAQAPWDLLNMRDLHDIDEPVLPPEYRLRTMREIANVPRRVAVHRAAWEPSSVTEQSYARVMRTWPYRDDLDFVVEALDGSLAASALGWYDEDNRVGEFEPVGTHPEHRRLGLARAVLLFGMQCLRDAGAEHAIIGCRGDDAYPVPKRVYESVGFREFSRDVPLIQA